MRFLHALERVLDPRVAIVESLSAYVSPRLAPDGMVDAMSDWLGLELREAPPGVHRRELLANADRLARTRGTRAGLELALRIGFPDLDLEVLDRGRVVIHRDVAPRSRERVHPGFVVRCSTPLSAGRRAAIEWAIERHRPMHVAYRLLATEPPSEPAERAR
jgi:phage tail-like protein